MPTYNARCHCGVVHVEIAKARPIDRLIDCNCSICTKKGVLHIAVEEPEFRLASGADATVSYRFGSEAADHRFCGRCGIHVYGRPRNSPDRYTVNARALDEFEAIRASARTILFDGQNHPKDAGD